MSLKEEDRKVIVTLELERVTKTLTEMEVQRQNGLWGMVANRLYYSLFHAVSALLVSDEREVGSHKGAAIRFHQYYVRTGIFTVDEGSFYSQMETLREKADYNCFFQVSESDIKACIEPTRQLIEKVKQYIADK